MSYIVLSILTGLIIASVLREFSFRNISGYSILALGGALYSEFIYLFLNEIYSISNPSLHSILLISGMLTFIGVKVAFVKMYERVITSRLSGLH